MNDPMFRSSDKYYLSGEEAFDRIVEKCVHLNYIKRRGNFTEEETTSMRVYVCVYCVRRLHYVCTVGQAIKKLDCAATKILWITIRMLVVIFEASGTKVNKIQGEV